jgi:hypothetical protein
VPRTRTGIYGINHICYELSAYVSKNQDGFMSVCKTKGKNHKTNEHKKGILQRVVLYSTSLICYTQELYFSDPLNQTNVGNRTGGLPFDRTEPITGKNVKQPNPLVAPRGDVTRSRMRCGAVVGERGGGSRRGWGGRSGVVTLRSLGWDGE